MINIMQYSPNMEQKEVSAPPSIYYSRFTVIIPAYNEEKRLPKVLREVADFISYNGLPWDVIVSVDGNDRTYEIVDVMSEEFTFIHAMGGKGRGGKGKAIKRALSISYGDFVMLMDADGSIDFLDMVKNIHLLNNCDAVVFDRYSSLGNSIPFMRRFASRGFNLLVQGFLGIRITDTQCGYKIIKADYAKNAFSEVSVSNAFFDVALFYYLNKQGAKCVEIPVKYRHGEDSKFNVIGLVLGQGTSLIAFRIRNSPLWKYVPKRIVDLYYRKFRWI